VKWNYQVGKLWDASRASLAAAFPGVSYAKVYEFQARGALHVHAIIRIPCDVKIRHRAVGRVLRGAEALLEVARSTVSGGVRWGREGDCRRIRHEGRRNKTVRYMAKMLTYVTKDVGGGLVTSGAVAEHHARLDDAALAMKCDRCGDLAEGCRSLAHRRWGARSSVLSKSRKSQTHLAWSSLRRMDLKAKRAAWARQAERARIALDTLARLCAGGLSGMGEQLPVMQV
jgi:hypothetical protein